MSRAGLSEFRDRRHAGQVLGEQVADRQLSDPVVLGLARGGVPVADEVAAAAAAPLRVTVARKIGAPGQPELALGAVTAEGPATYDPRLLRSFGLDESSVGEECDRERAEARRREQQYGQGPAAPVADRDVVLVDDGLATGATARAAIRMVREQGPASIVLAVPVGAPDAVRALEAEADVVLSVLRPAGFGAVGQFYRDFGATDDAEITQILQQRQDRADRG